MSHDLPFDNFPIGPSEYDTHGSLGSISKAVEFSLNLEYKPFWIRFAILHKPTGKYLPERWRRGRGYSHDEPSFDFPRLFPSERSARAALRNWLQGEWEEVIRGGLGFERESSGPEPTEVKGRYADDMEIVRFKVERI